MFGEGKDISFRQPFRSISDNPITEIPPGAFDSSPYLQLYALLWYFSFDPLQDLDYGLQFARSPQILSLIPLCSSVGFDLRQLTMPNTLLWRTAMSYLMIIQRRTSTFLVKVWFFQKDYLVDNRF
jgi:hypothetical protein